MPLALTVRTGALAGRTFTFDHAMISVGRTPGADLQFDAQQDIDVSGKHAEIVVIGSRVVMRDLGSTNGTWINGARLESDSEIYDGDVIAFGEHGPQVMVSQTGRMRTGDAAPRASAPATRVSSSARAPSGAMSPPSAPVVPAPVAPAPAAPAPVVPSPKVTPGHAPRSTQMRIDAAVEKSTKKLQYTIVGVATVLGLFAVGAYAYGKKQSDDAIRALQAQVDSTRAVYASVIADAKGKAMGLDTVLSRIQRENERLREQLGQGGDGAHVEELKRQLEDSRRRGQLVMDAAKVDFSVINEKSGKAVALLIVEMPDGSRSAATGFCVNEKGVLVTNRHAVRDAAMNSPTRIAVLFNETVGWQPAHLVRTGDGDDDLAVLQMDRPGPYPVVAGIANAGDSTKVGQPVALIGFPLGTDAAQDGTGTKIRASASLGVGTVSKTLERLTQIDAFATHGSSGSPVFDARGFVVGVVYGGPTEAAGRIVYAVPAARLNAELAK